MPPYSKEIEESLRTIRIFRVVDESRIPDALNSSIDSDESNKPVAYWLSCIPEGLNMLAEDDFALARQISTATLNTDIETLLCGGESLVYRLSRTLEGQRILAANHFALALRISAETLNTVIRQGRFTGFSVAYWLSSTPKGVAILAANDFALARQISAATLNTVIANKDNAGTSVAYWLSSTLEGQSILAANDFALARQISAETFKTVIASGDNAGTSVAYFLSEIIIITREGGAILAANDFALARQISAETLNTVISSWYLKGFSVAYWLSHSSEGRAILAADDFALARQISAETLNAVIHNTTHSGGSIAHCLSRSPEGCAILAANDYALARKISAETLNSGPGQRRFTAGSVGYWLSHSLEGIAILAHNNYSLALQIFPSILDCYDEVGRTQSISTTNWLHGFKKFMLLEVLGSLGLSEDRISELPEITEIFLNSQLNTSYERIRNNQTFRNIRDLCLIPALLKGSITINDLDGTYKTDKPKMPGLLYAHLCCLASKDGEDSKHLGAITSLLSSQFHKQKLDTSMRIALRLRMPTMLLEFLAANPKMALKAFVHMIDEITDENIDDIKVIFMTMVINKKYLHCDTLIARLTHKFAEKAPGFFKDKVGSTALFPLAAYGRSNSATREDVASNHATVTSSARSNSATREDVAGNHATVTSPNIFLNTCNIC